MRGRSTRVVVSSNERDLLLRAFERGLDEGESILRVVDRYVAGGPLTLDLPLDPSAEVLLAEPPHLLPGGVTEIVSYLRVRDRTVRRAIVHGATAWPREPPAARSAAGEPGLA